MCPFVCWLLGSLSLIFIVSEGQFCLRIFPNNLVDGPFLRKFGKIYHKAHFSSHAHSRYLTNHVNTMLSLFVLQSHIWTNKCSKKNSSSSLILTRGKDPPGDWSPFIDREWLKKQTNPSSDDCSFGTTGYLYANNWQLVSLNNFFLGACT